MTRARGERGSPKALLSAYRTLIADVYELAGLSRRTSDVMARQTGQTVAQWHLMSALGDGPRSVSQVARRLGLTRQSVQRVADDLIRNELARSVPDPGDARAPKIELTETGQRATKTLFARSGKVRARQLARAGLSEEDLVAAQRTLRAICEAIDDDAVAQEPPA